MLCLRVLAVGVEGGGVGVGVEGWEGRDMRTDTCETANNPVSTAPPSTSNHHHHSTSLR